MYDDPKRYDHDDYYGDESLDNEDEYEADDYDYIVDDEDEEETALWDEGEDTDEPPRKKRQKKAVFSDSNTDSDDTELDEYKKHGVLLLKNGVSSTNWKPMRKKIPLRTRMKLMTNSRSENS